jgi:hypothetical protein
MMKNVLLLAMIAAFIIVGLTAISSNEPKGPIVVGGSIDSCTEDSECVAVSAGCCNCNYGGSNIAINKAFQTAYEKNLSVECRQTACPAVISTDPSCFAAPSCVNNKCTLVPVRNA